MPDIYSAYRASAFPCNPRPFLSALNDLIQIEGTRAIETDRAKKLLFVVMSHAYGQCATIDLYDEWSRLNELDEKEVQQCSTP